ncbi:MAG: hypothetical protein RE468_12160 [Acidithiobacillus caldus]|uniref:IS66 family transposase n=1 Tax=Acidithiobacillus caldus TaxID=33059 RepID=UPI001C07AC07|nr:hypothetical protein [Acidithiobacillus caldus]MBU2790598.1 hypothetical protein [Acidithiobacillus caldus]MBU2819944.1 hypothetical protein [Acidithiobacillus caldus]WMT46628.1 MAG: hypothetical protein RE468_12160 [Acidithiobacillus caldus]
METAEIPIPKTYPEALAAWQLQRALNAAIQEELQGLQQQLDWLHRQVFGQKSERRVPPPPVEQLSLGQDFSADEAPQAPLRSVAAHTRRASRHPEDRAESLPFFDEGRVPIETILLPAPEAEGLDPGSYEVIDTKVSYRLAQRPGSYVVLKYVRPVIKLRETETLHTAPAPVGVLEGSRADVSLLAGVLVDKFLYHLPLYRQH